jgi:asparagine synthase (glutamine-hydrolysing)
MGAFHEGPIALAHARLAIIDLDTGDQPMFNEDRRIAVVFNGEIYNYRELKSELGSRHRFTSESDTEILVHLYEDFGERFVSKLQGMFSFAIWDAQNQRLFAARDRFGEKPFLYLQDSQNFFFASELAAFATTGRGGELDRAALSDYLRLLYVPAPKTIWKNVRKLPAGHALTVDRAGMRVSCYWRPPQPGREARATVSPEDVQSEIRRAVRSQLGSDVPIGALLSGGIDSSTIVAFTAEEIGPGLKTFSVGFGRDDDELEYARLVANRFRTEHHELIIAKDLATQVPEALKLFSEPFGDSSAVPTALIFRELAKHVKVALTGDGGDELFGGYGRYRTVQRFPTLPLLPARWAGFSSTSSITRKAGRLMRLMTSHGLQRYLALLEVFNRRERAALLGLTEESSSFGQLGRAQGNANSAIEFDLEVYLPDDLLTKVDISAMGAGVESRAPFLDYRLAEQVIPQPLNAKLRGADAKLLLKRAVASHVPAPILARAKRGFGSPVKEWLAGDLRHLFQDTLASRNSMISGWLHRSAVDATVRDALREGGNAHQAWALFALEMWAQTHARSPRTFKATSPKARGDCTTRPPKPAVP